MTASETTIIETTCPICICKTCTISSRRRKTQKKIMGAHEIAQGMRASMPVSIAESLQKLTQFINCESYVRPSQGRYWRALIVVRYITGLSSRKISCSFESLREVDKGVEQELQSMRLLWSRRSRMYYNWEIRYWSSWQLISIPRKKWTGPRYLIANLTLRSLKTSRIWQWESRVTSILLE